MSRPLSVMFYNVQSIAPIDVWPVLNYWKLFYFNFQPEGVEQIHSQSLLIDLTDDNVNELFYQFDIELPATGLVSGSEYIYMVVIGKCAKDEDVK